MEDMKTENYDPSIMMEKQKNFDRIKRINGLKENIEICDAKISSFENNVQMWKNIKEQTIRELEQITEIQ